MEKVESRSKVSKDNDLKDEKNRDKEEDKGYKIKKEEEDKKDNKAKEEDEKESKAKEEDKKDNKAKEEDEKDKEKEEDKVYKTKEADKKEKKAKFIQTNPKEIVKFFKNKNLFQNKEKELFKREKKVIKKEIELKREKERIQKEKEVFQKEKEELLKREKEVQKQEELLKREKEVFKKEKEELLKREKEIFQKEKNNANKEIGITESGIKPYGKEVINKIKKSVQTYEEKKEQNDDIRNQDKEKEISDITTKNENKSNDNKDKENTSKEENINSDGKTMPIIVKNKEEKKENNKNVLGFRKNENTANIFEVSLGENMHNTNYIDARNKEIVDVEKYEDGNKKELNVCYLDVCSCHKNNVENEEKKHENKFESVQNIIDKSLSHGNPNEIEINDEKVIKKGDGDVCSNEEKRNIVIKSVVCGKDNDKEMNKGKEDNRKVSPMPDENQKEKVENP